MTQKAYTDLKDEQLETTGFVRPNPTVKRVGFVDLGSNSSRLTIVEFDVRGRVTILDRVKSMVRLGEKAFETKELQPQAMARALTCLDEFVKVCESFGVKEIVAVGTAALRIAKNSQAFVDEVKAKTGMDLSVISGEEEARLIRVGIWDAFPKTKDAFLFIDIGGGSTELSVSSRSDIEVLESLNVGCVMVTDAFTQTKTGKVSTTVFEKMQALALRKMQYALADIKAVDYRAAVASSGTAQALMAFAQSQRVATNPLEVCAEGVILPLADLESAAKTLCQMTMVQRRTQAGLSPARAEVIVGGAAILVQLLKALKLESVIVTASNLQDGQVVDYIERHYPKEGQKENYWRRKSVKRLAKRHHYQKPHAKHLKQLALGIYASAIEEKLCATQEGLEELLGYAARMHDIGIDIGYDRHHEHGAYLVRHSSLLGFTEHEIMVMARMVFMHGRPSSTLPQFLEGSVVTQAEKMAGLSLFLAENLDRTHRSLVKEARFVRKPQGLVLEVNAQAPAPIEKSTLEKLKKHLKKVLGETVDVDFHEETPEPTITIIEE